MEVSYSTYQKGVFLKMDIERVPDLIKYLGFKESESFLIGDDALFCVKKKSRVKPNGLLSVKHNESERNESQKYGWYTRKILILLCTDLLVTFQDIIPFALLSQNSK